jgi:hypothetical protein
LTAEVLTAEEEEDGTATTLDATDGATTDEAATDEATEEATDVAELATGAAELATTVDDAEEATALPLASAAGMLESSALLQPVLLVRAAGHSTCLKSTVGLSAPMNHPKRKSHPGLRAAGKLEQLSAAEIPPYCAPHPDEGAPNWVVQPLKIPTPPPGMARSNWLAPRSPPVFVA